MTIEERVAAYFDREMNPEEVSSFENELDSNAELKREFNFQKDIIDGLHTARKAELKTMLNNVPIGGTSFLGASKWVQYFSAAIITAFVGFGIYYFWPDTNSVKEESSVEAPIEETIDEIEESEPVLSEENKEIAEDNTKQEASSPAIIEVPQSTSTDKELKEEKENIAVDTESIRPTPIQGLDQQETSDPDIPENDLVDKSSYGEEPITTEIISDIRKYNFHYMFESGKLMLYGDFNETYEILDFIQDGERTVYLYYIGNYYSLSLSRSEVSPLEKISDQSTIRSLEQKRKSR